MKRLLATVVSVKPLTGEMGYLIVKLPENAEKAQAGQFAHISVPGDRRNLLRRPISIYSAHDGLLELAIAGKGEGTQRILAAKEGDVIDILYPLGNGFEKKEHKRIVFVGGGIGVAPLRYTMEEYADENCTAIFGYRNAELLYGIEECEKTGAKVVVCTDDGSYGLKGLVTLPLEEMLKAGAVDCIMACGPTPMLRAVQKLALQYEVEAQLSLEEHMGCGIGACLTCNCKVKAVDAEFGYKRVCADGPVLDAKEVIFG